MFSLSTVLFALVGGILPALVWLFFWLREDSLHPEPKRVIVASFLLGMLAVVFVLPFEHVAVTLLQGTFLVVLAWAIIEEAFKYGAAYLGGIRKKTNDEPIDPLIYLITAALGFAALENVFFLISSAEAGIPLISVVTGNVRFIGATLLHTVSSGAIGLARALSFYKSKKVQHTYRVVGFVVAVGIHTLFNYLVLQAESSALFTIFAFVWVAVILLILFFEKVKRLKRAVGQKPTPSTDAQ